MKLFLSLCLVSLLSGCFECVPVKVPVYQSPKFEMPDRPVLREYPTISAQSGIIEFDTRAEEENMLYLSKYANQLERLLKSLKSNETINTNSKQ